ncbi:hypothetical protein Tco_0821127 [Tanacetum coccineum]|uniref:Uncharacterized protein n=1 Tax=Tanacetum coccineum TaxID=301880 RepID=A0ABQ5AFL0_9ASTR
MVRTLTKESFKTFPCFVRSSHVRIDLGGSLSNQSRASPSREKGKSKSFIEVFGTSGCLNVEVTLLKNRRFNTTAGNPVKEILLKLNLPDHRSILTDLKANVPFDQLLQYSLSKVVTDTGRVTVMLSSPSALQPSACYRASVSTMFSEGSYAPSCKALARWDPNGEIMLVHCWDLWCERGPAMVFASQRTERSYDCRPFNYFLIGSRERRMLNVTALLPLLGYGVATAMCSLCARL